MVDTRLPSSLTTVVGCIVQGSFILLIPVIVTPQVVVFFAAISIVYIYLLVSFFLRSFTFTLAFA